MRGFRPAIGAKKTRAAAQPNQRQFVFFKSDLGAARCFHKKCLFVSLSFC